MSAEGDGPVHASSRAGSGVHDWAEVCAELRRASHTRLVILDIDPAVAGWGADAQAVRQGLLRIEEPLSDALPDGCLLVWATNSSRLIDGFGPPPWQTPAGNPLIFAARKPFMYRLNGILAGSLRRPGTVVVGDQWLTDGLLARRLHARFLPFHDRRHRQPIWAALQQLLGYLLVRPLFSIQRSRSLQAGGAGAAPNRQADERHARS